MSGIAGCWSHDPEVSAIEPLLEGIQYRGRDGTRFWSSKHVELAHALLISTPEAHLDEMPRMDSATGCVITADLRLDNREELAEKLRSPSRLQDVGDAELLLLAYRKWGADCTSHLLGDFAFVIWDPRTNHMFGARDHTGAKPFYYSIEREKLFLFASDFDALNNHPLTPRTLNHDRLIDFFEGLEGADETSTFNTSVFRLPPAHRFWVRDGRLEVEKYWSQPKTDILNLPSDAEYEQRFQDVFREAVRCRLRGTEVGAMLSGGLDSGLVSAVASSVAAELGHGRLKTFSAVNIGSEYCEETDRIHSYKGDPRFKAHFLNAADMNEYINELRHIFATKGDPFDYWMTIIQGVYLIGRDQGVTAMLDGMGGDLVFGCGNQAAELLHQGHPRLALKSIREARNFDDELGRDSLRFIASFWAAFVPLSVKRVSNILKSKWRARSSRAFAIKYAGQFAQTNVIAERRRKFSALLEDIRPFAPTYRFRMINHPSVTAARERYERAAALAGIEPRDPYRDKRVIEFVLSLPTSQLCRDGWPKFIQRRWSEKELPSAIVWRPGKAHLGVEFSRRLLTDWPEIDHETTKMRESLTDFVDGESVDELVQKRDKIALAPLLRLSFFLRRSRLNFN